MEGLNTLEGDGCLSSLYYHIWKRKPNAVEAAHDIRIPSTVVFGHNFPSEWYTVSRKSGEVERRMGKEITSAAIEADFIPRRSTASRRGLGLSTVVATYLAQVKDDAGVSKTWVQFLDRKGLKDFLYNQCNRPDGILQKFVAPEGRFNEVIQAVWSPAPNVQLVSKRQNQSPYDDRRTSMYERCVTYEGPMHFSREVFVAPHIQWQVKRQCRHFVRHFASTEQLEVHRMVLYFKVDFQGDLWLLWCSSFRVSHWGVEYPLTLGVDFATDWDSLPIGDADAASLITGSMPNYGTVDEEAERLAEIHRASRQRARGERQVSPDPSLGPIGDLCAYSTTADQRARARARVGKQIDRALAVIGAELSRSDDDEAFAQMRWMGRPKTDSSSPPPLAKERFKLAEGPKAPLTHSGSFARPPLKVGSYNRSKRRQSEGVEPEPPQPATQQSSPRVTSPRTQPSPLGPQPTVILSNPVPRLGRSPHPPGPQGHDTTPRRHPGVPPPAAVFPSAGSDILSQPSAVNCDDSEFVISAGLLLGADEAEDSVQHSRAAARRRWARVRAAQRAGALALLCRAFEMQDWAASALYSTQLQRTESLRIAVPQHVQTVLGATFLERLTSFPSSSGSKVVAVWETTELPHTVGSGETSACIVDGMDVTGAQVYGVLLSPRHRAVFPASSARPATASGSRVVNLRISAERRTMVQVIQRIRDAAAQTVECALADARRRYQEADYAPASRR